MGFASAKPEKPSGTRQDAGLAAELASETALVSLARLLGRVAARNPSTSPVPDDEELKRDEGA